MKLDLEKINYFGKPVVLSFLPVKVPADLCEFYYVNRYYDYYDVKGKVDALISDRFTEEEVNLVRKRNGLVIVVMKKEEVKEEIETLKWIITYSKKLLLRKDERYIYFIFSTKPSKYEKERFRKLKEFLLKEENLEKIKEVSDLPKIKLKRRTNPKVEIVKHSEMFEIYKKTADEQIERLLEKIRSEFYEIESLAPPKPGHVLVMIAAGMADGKYDNLLVKGITETVEDVEEEEDGTVVKVEKPITKIRVVNLDNLSFEEIS